MTEDREHLCSQLSAFLDGQLPPDQAERVAAALEKDPTLRAELKGLEATRSLVRKLPRELAPASLLGSVMQQIERERLLTAPPARTREPLRWVRHLATAAIILLGVGLGIYLYDSLRQPGFPDYPGQSPNVSVPQPLAKGGPDDSTRPGVDDAKKGADDVVVAEKSMPARPADNYLGQPAGSDVSKGYAGAETYFANNSLPSPDVGQMAAGSQNVVIVASDPVLANRFVQESLERNNVYNIEAAPSIAVAGNAKTDDNVVARGNFFSVANVDRQTRYVAYVEPAQAVQLASELRKYKQVSVIAPAPGQPVDRSAGGASTHLGKQLGETAPSLTPSDELAYVAKSRPAARGAEPVLSREETSQQKDITGQPDLDGVAVRGKLSYSGSASRGAAGPQEAQSPASAPSAGVPVTLGYARQEETLAAAARGLPAPATRPAPVMTPAAPAPVAVAQARPAPTMPLQARAVPSSSPVAGMDVAATSPASPAGAPLMEQEAAKPHFYGGVATLQADDPTTRPVDSLAGRRAEQQVAASQPASQLFQYERQMQASTSQATPLLLGVHNGIAQSQPATQASQPQPGSVANAATTLDAQQLAPASQPAPPPLGRLTRLVIIVDEQPTSQPASQAK